MNDFKLNFLISKNNKHNIIKIIEKKSDYKTNIIELYVFFIYRGMVFTEWVVFYDTDMSTIVNKIDSDLKKLKTKLGLLLTTRGYEKDYIRGDPLLNIIYRSITKKSYFNGTEYEEEMSGMDKVEPSEEEVLVFINGLISLGNSYFDIYKMSMKKFQKLPNELRL